MQSRRAILKHSTAVAGLLAATGLFPRYALAWNAAAFEGKSVAEVMKALGASAPVESRAVTLTAPDIAENGAFVPFTVASSLPGVRQLLVLVEKNPRTLVARFDMTDAVEASFSIRAKMDQSSDVYVVAITADGKAHFARRDVKVTLGGCAA